MLVAARTTWRTVALVEVATMFVALLSYIWAWQRTFAGASLLIIALYCGLGLMSHLRRHETAWYLGLRADNLARALRNALFIAVPAVVVALGIGLALGTWHFPSWLRILKEAPWMVAWATAQQYGLLCFFYRRFLEIFADPAAATASAAVMFATFHIPNVFLIAVTLAAGVAACTLYRRETNLFAIGVAHALVSIVLLCSLPESVTHGLRVGPGYLAGL